MPPPREAINLCDLSDAPAAAGGRVDLNRVGLVVIGRNEGWRLRRCLETALRQTNRIVYVDSGSTDGSPELSRRLRLPVVELSPKLPFSAARARNAGLERLLKLYPNVEYVQFIDGDCEIDAGWLARGIARLDASPRLAAVAGRCRERFPNRTIYHRLCQIEWDVPTGEARACGGNSMMRIAAFREAGGFNPAVIAGEEPELCARLRQCGWSLWRADAEMVSHDADMARFSQWWWRAVRSGYAYAQGAALHGNASERHCVRESRSIWFWGFYLPVAALAPAWPTGGLSLLLFAGYLLLAWRIRRHCRQRSLGTTDTRLYTAFTILGKFPQLLGQCKFHADRLLGRTPRIIEHKNPAS